MNGTDLSVFHEVSANLDFGDAMEALLGEFRRGRIADRDRTQENSAIRSHLGEQHAAWDRVLPGFPDCPWKRRSLRWEHMRGRRDAYLRRLIVSHTPGHDAGRRLIVNPATVFGRHARAVARELPAYDVVGTDIDRRFDSLYRVVSPWTFPGLSNYSFERENIFEPDLERKPAAVVFFGACGALTDGCMDYAVAVKAPFVICRSCCHENIGGNTEIVRRPGLLNRFFAFKNVGFARFKKKGRGLYFSARHDKDAYPRSEVARKLMDSDTIVDVARNSVDSDVCRSLIDLDRCLFLREQGYDVLYREELFFAHLRS